MPPIPLITKIRILALVIAVFLVVGGLEATLHPKLRLVSVSQTFPAESQSSQIKIYPVELVTSQASRAFGIVRMITGSVIALYVLSSWLSMYKTKAPRIAERKDEYAQKSE